MRARRSWNTERLRYPMTHLHSTSLRAPLQFRHRKCKSLHALLRRKLQGPVSP